MQQQTLTRTKFPPALLFKKALTEPGLTSVFAERARRCQDSLFYTLNYFWDQVSDDEFKPNWHITQFCEELETLAYRVAEGEAKEYDLIVNVPPGTTKTITFSIIFPVWCWMKWPWMRFIACSYSAALALESAEYSRDLVRSDKFRRLFPELSIKADKDQKGNFRLQVAIRDDNGNIIGYKTGGNRLSTSVGGSVIGFHGHIILVDDPIDPEGATSEAELTTANHFMTQTLSLRKADKAVTPTVLVMQRLHQDDPSGHLLNLKGSGVKHLCLPGELTSYRQDDGTLREDCPLQPREFEGRYQDDLLDPVRLGLPELSEAEEVLGQYGYSGQIEQNPVPPGGGMFQVDRFQIVDKMPPDVNIAETVRYWDKAGTDEKDLKRKGGAFTCGVKMHRIEQVGLPTKWLIEDVRRGQWRAEIREAIIRETAEADGHDVKQWHEQEPGSGGKESAENTIDNLAGYSSYAERPVGNKLARADTFSVQVNRGNVWLLRGDWNTAFKEEYRYAPFSTRMDQVDSGSGAFRRLTGKKQVRVLGRRGR